MSGDGERVWVFKDIGEWVGEGGVVKEFQRGRDGGVVREGSGAVGEGEVVEGCSFADEISYGILSTEEEAVRRALAVGEGEVREGVCFDIRFGLEGAVEEGEVIVLRVDDIFTF